MSATAEHDSNAHEADEPQVAAAGFADTPRMREPLHGRVWGIVPEVLVELATTLRAREVEIDMEAARPGPAYTTQPAAKGGGNLAVIPLHGAITPRGSMIARLFGMPSGLEAFRESFREALADDTVSGILLDVDSPGGLIDGVPETAAEVFGARGVKPIVAVANTCAASAAYWIASQADELIVTPSGQVGSIGVFAVHEDVSRLEQAMGITTTIISAGRFKTEGNPFEPLSKAAAQAMQANVDDLYDMFTGDIARARNQPIQAIQSGYGEGRVMLADRAKALGMVDGIETLEQVAMRLGGSLPAEPDEEAPDVDELDDEPQGRTRSDAPAPRHTPGADRPSWQLGGRQSAPYTLSRGPERPSWQIGASRP